MARKKINEDIDLDFDLPDVVDDDDSDGDTLDPLFQNYYTPPVSDDEDAPEDETFLEAVEAENEQVLADLERADDEIKTLTNTKKAVVSGVDTDYFFCVVFVSEEQKKAFIEQSGWDVYGGARYLSGIEMARDMGIELPPAYLATDSKEDKSLAQFIRKE